MYYFNQYIEEKGIEYHQLMLNERIFSADDYFDWLDEKGKMSLSSLNTMESTTDRQLEHFVHTFYPFQWYSRMHKYSTIDENGRYTGIVAASLAFTHFPKALIDIVASFVFGTDENGHTNSCGFGTYFETFHDAKCFRAICKSIHSLFPQQRVAEMYCLSTYEELQDEINTEFNTLVQKKSAMDVSSIYQLSPDHVRHCVIQTVGRKKYYLQGDLINASELRFPNSYPKRLRSLRFRMQQSEGRKRRNRSAKSTCSIQ